MKKTTQAIKLATLLEHGTVTDVTKDYVNDPVLKQDIEAGCRAYLFEAKEGSKLVDALMCTKDIGNFLSYAYRINFGL